MLTEAIKISIAKRVEELCLDSEKALIEQAIQEANRGAGELDYVRIVTCLKSVLVLRKLTLDAKRK